MRSFGTGYVTTNWDRMALYGVKRGFGVVSANAPISTPTKKIPAKVLPFVPKSPVVTPAVRALVSAWAKKGKVAA